MSDANMATSTKQVIVSLVIVGVMVATADQIGRNFLLSSLNTRMDSVEARLDSFESSIIARLDSFEKNIDARLVRAEKGETPAPDSELR